jgi:hypothetical protein
MLSEHSWDPRIFISCCMYICISSVGLHRRDVGGGGGGPEGGGRTGFFRNS